MNRTIIDQNFSIYRPKRLLVGNQRFHLMNWLKTWWLLTLNWWNQDQMPNFFFSFCQWFIYFWLGCIRIISFVVYLLLVKIPFNYYLLKYLWSWFFFQSIFVYLFFYQAHNIFPSNVKKNVNLSTYLSGDYIFTRESK